MVNLENKKLDIEKWAKEKEELIEYIENEIKKEKCNENCIGCIKIAKKVELEYQNMINNKIIYGDIKKNEKVINKELDLNEIKKDIINMKNTIEEIKTHKNKEENQIKKKNEMEEKTNENKRDMEQIKVNIKKLQEDLYYNNIRLFDAEKKILMLEEFNNENENKN